MDYNNEFQGEENSTSSNTNLLKQTKKAKQMRELRRKRALEAGRDVGAKGRPKVITRDSSIILENKIKEDANIGMFHNVEWIQDLVFLVIMFEV
jgi:hypothetical protein